MERLSAWTFLLIQVAIIGGSGFYSLSELKDPVFRSVQTEFGDPSDEIAEGSIDGVPCVVLARCVSIKMCWRDDKLSKTSSLIQNCLFYSVQKIATKWILIFRSLNQRQKIITIIFFQLFRHGRGHSISPSEVNYRANIWALKSLGVTHILSATCCGSLRFVWTFGKETSPPVYYDQNLRKFKQC